MIYLILSILSFTAIVLIFKLFDKYKVHTFHTIVYNYIVAAILGFYIAGGNFSITQITQKNWFPNAIIIGILFISLFYLVALTAQKVSVAVSIIANKMSVVIPVIFAFFLYDDSITFLKISGIILALAGVILTFRKDKDIDIGNKKYIFLPVVLFIGSGLLDTYIKYSQEYYLQKDELLIFIPCLFAIAAIAGIIIVLSRQLLSPEKFYIKNLLWGVLIGLFNYSSVYFLIKTLELERFESSAVFPVNNMGIVIVATIAAFFLYKEKLSKQNWIGIILSVIAIAMIAFDPNT